MTACPLLRAGRDRGARRGAGAARAGPSRPVPASRAPPDPGARGSSRQRVGRVKCDMRRSGRGGAQAGRGCCWLFPSHQPSRWGAPSRPGPAQHPPPARQARHSLRGHVASCRPRGHAVGWQPGGGRAGSGRKRAPGRGGRRGPPERNSSPSCRLGPHAGRGTPGRRLVRMIAPWRLGPAARRVAAQVCEMHKQPTARRLSLRRRLGPAAAPAAAPPERAPPPNSPAAHRAPVPFPTCTT